MGSAVSEEVRDASAATKRSTPGLLRPILQSGRVDVSDIESLRGDALREVMVARANALRPLFESNAAETETNRRVVEENIVALRLAGLFKVMLPRRFGGLQADLRTKRKVAATVAKGFGATAWVTTQMNVDSLIMGMASAECQKDVWGENPDARIAGVLSPTATTRRVQGGLPWTSCFRLTALRPLQNRVPCSACGEIWRRVAATLSYHRKSAAKSMARLSLA